MLPTLLKSVASPSRLHPYHLHHPLSPPFVIHGGKRKQQSYASLVLAGPPRWPPDGRRLFARSGILIIPKERGSRREAAEVYSWRMRSRCRSRNWSSGAVDRGSGRDHVDLADHEHDDSEAPREAARVSQSEGIVVGVNGSSEQQERKDSASAQLLTLPTVLTLARVAAVPLLVSTFYMNGPWTTTATTCIFMGAAITDWLDGYIARKMQLRTSFGAFLDPVADKLMVATTLVLLCTRPPEAAAFVQAPWLLTVPSIAIIGREITMSAVREWAASQDSKVNEAVAVNSLGKWKTATQMAALTILLVTRDPSLSGIGGLIASGIILLYISSGLAVWSLVVYMRNIWRVLLK